VTRVRLACIALLVLVVRPGHAQVGSGGAADQIEASKLSKLPVQTRFVEAEYPPQAREQGIEAEVILLLDIDEQGKITAVGIAEPAEPPDIGFDEAALVAAQSFEFEPAEMDGKPIAVQITYRYRFTLTPATATPPPAPDQTVIPPAPPPPARSRPPTVNLAGQLLERGTRDPLVGVTITVFRDDVDPPVGFEATSNASGQFEFYDLSPGEWKILVEPPGYYPYRTSEQIATGERVDVTYHVERGSYNPYDVTITAKRPRKEVSRTVIAAEEIDKIPGGAGDPLTVVQNFAGVARTASPALLVVRGSAPEDTRVFVDGIGVPIIFHFGGLKSVIPVGVLQSIEFYPGNFSPIYGRAIGGIIDVRVKDLTPNKLGGYADVSILDTGVYLETPVGDKAAVAIAGRRSYIDGILSLAIPDSAGVTLRTAPRYYDVQLLANYRPKRTHNLRFFGFGSDDRLRLLFDNPADLDPALEGNDISNVTTFYRGLLQHRYVPGTGFENDLRVSAGYETVRLSAGQLGFDIALTSAQLRNLSRIRLSDRVTLVAGTDVSMGVADVFVKLPRPPKEGAPTTDVDLSEIVTTTSEGDRLWAAAAFVEAEVKAGPGLLVLPGLRLDYFGLTGQTVLQPRLTARWQVTEPATLKGGVGLFVQEPQLDETDEVFGNPDLMAERAIHYSVGAEYKPAPWLTLDATAFYKDMSELVSPTDAVVMDGSTARLLLYDNGGTGTVYGLELQARHDLAHNLTGWLAYTLSRARRTDSGSAQSRLFDFDQPHILTVVANYRLPRNWLVGGRLRLVSGSPNTPVIASVFNSSTDQYDPVFGPVNSGRNRTFHQLDLRVDKRWIYQGWILNAYLDIQNTYNRANAEGVAYNFDYSDSEALPSIPILTIIGLRAEF
jgi:TonB family protein